MKTNDTPKLNARVVREARLEELARKRRAYHSARRRALARLREGMDLRWTPPKSRDELHRRLLKLSCGRG
jgi:hypothetical protein